MLTTCRISMQVGKFYLFISIMFVSWVTETAHLQLAALNIEWHVHCGGSQSVYTEDSKGQHSPKFMGQEKKNLLLRVHQTRPSSRIQKDSERVSSVFDAFGNHRYGVQRYCAGEPSNPISHASPPMARHASRTGIAV